MNEFKAMQILDLLDSVGEDALNGILSDFSCPRNSEIEDFLKKNSVDFARKKMSITHLIMNSSMQCVAYFTLAHKPINVREKDLSKTAHKKMARYAKFDEALKAYTVATFLLAQLGKNYAVESSISGNRIMDLVYDRLAVVQHEIGGGIAFLECEDKERLIRFYESGTNAYKRFGVRYSRSDNVKYIQMLRFL